MPKRKVKVRTKKRGSTLRAKPQRKASRNWSLIRQKWYQTSLTFRAFCRAQKISTASASRHGLSLADKESFLKKTAGAAEKFRDRLVAMAAKDDSRLYISTLKHVSMAVQEVLLDSAQSFKESPHAMSQKESGRLVLASGELLLKVTGDLQGIPDEDDLDGWPLTKLFTPFTYQRDFCLDTPKGIRIEEGLPSDGTKDPFLFAFCGGRGAGKTYVGAQKAGQLAWLNRGYNGLVLAPTYPMLRDAAKAAFLKACTDKGLSFKHLKTENAVILFGDTKVYFRSMDDPDKVRGLNVAWAWMDEPGQVGDREAFDVVNGCIRGEDIPEPALIITTTPSGLGWFYEVVVTEAEENRARLYRARTADNPLLGDFEKRLRRSYDPLFAAQELDAEFVNLFSGQAYWNFSPIDNVFNPRDISLVEGLPLDLCCDFNVSPMCWNVSQDFLIDGETYTYVFDEIHLDTAGTDVTVKEFLDRWGSDRSVRGAGVRVWGDATGQHKVTAATRTDYEIIEAALKEEGIPVDINLGRSNPRQRDRVLAVNARLLSADQGLRRFFVSKGCKHTIIDFERTTFIPGTQQLDKSQVKATGAAGKRRKPALTHHTDALGYKVFRQWPLRAPRIEQQRAA